MSAKGGAFRGAKAKARKEASGWESNPPKCASCVHYRPCIYGQPAMKMRYIPRHCALHGFETHAQALCDDWRNKRGETLEQP